jgi:hypothetical protein
MPSSHARRLAAVVALALTPVLSQGAARAGTFRLSDGQSYSDVGRAGEVADNLIELPQVSPDGSQAVYVHDAETDGAYELWRAPIGGGPPVRISGLLPSGERARFSRFTPDGARVLYLAPQDNLTELELYSAPLNGPPNSFVKANAPIPTNKRVLPLGVSPDSQRVAYAVCDLGGASCNELWVASLDGTAQTLLHASGAGRILLSEGASPDFSRVVYVEENQGGGDVIELWSVPTAGGDPVKINGVLVTDGDVSRFTISPTGDRVLYVGDQQTNGVDEVYVAPIGGGGAIKANAPLPAGAFVEYAFFVPGSDRLVYGVTSGANHSLWSGRLDGSAADPLNPPLAGGDILPVFWTADA